MSKPVAAVCLLFISLVTPISAFEIGDKVVTARECVLKEGGVFVKRARIGEQFLIERVDGRRLLLGGAGSVWADDVDFLALEAAVEHFSRLIKKNPADWQSLCARGRAREELGQNHSGMNDLDEAVRLHPCSETYRIRAGAYANRDRNQRAFADFDEAIRRDPKSAEVFRNRAMVFSNLRMYDKSLADINKAVELEPESAFLLTCRGMILMHNDLPIKALADADEALRRIPSYVYARKLRGSALHTLHRNDEAIAEYSAVLKVNSRDVTVLIDRGCTWHESDHPDKAIADFCEAIKLEPNPFAYMFRGLVYSEIEDYAKAESDFNYALKRDPSKSQIWLARAVARTNMGKVQEAIQDCDEAIKIDPENFQNYLARVMAFNESERFEEAIKDCEQLIRLKPNSAKSYFYRGVEYRALGKWNEAIADLELALKLDGNDAQVLAEAAYLRAACPVEEIRNPTAALKLATQAVNQSQGKLRFAHRALAAAYAAQGDFEKATEAQKQTVKLAIADDKAEEQERLALYEARKPFRFK